MTDAEKLERIAQVLAGSPAPMPLPETMESKLRGLAADWLETPSHSVYGQTILDVLDGN
jgi:hypothetical protein